MNYRLKQEIKDENIKYVKEYINTHGVDSFKDDDGLTPLYYAIYYGCLLIVELLVNNGCNIEAKDKFGATPLYTAINFNHFEIIKFLLTMLCIVDEQSSLNKGANINIEDGDGWTPLHRAVVNSDLKIVELLLIHGANRELLTITGNKPIEMTENKEIIDLLETWQDLPEIKEPDV